MQRRNRCGTRGDGPILPQRWLLPLPCLAPRPWRPGLRPAPPAAATLPDLWLIDRRDPWVRRALPELLPLLSAAEGARLEAFRLEDDRERFLLGRAALRQLLGGWLGLDPHRLPLVEGPHGKPALAIDPPAAGMARPAAGMEFNLAHSGELVLLAFHPLWAVGVDVEQLRPALHWLPIARRLLPAASVAWLSAMPEQQGCEEFLQQWCLLEAELKARGTGLAGSGEAPVAESPDRPLEGAQACILQLPPGYRGALSWLPPPPPLAMAAAGDLPRSFADRAALEAALRQRFPAAEGGLSPIRGGGRAAAARLAAIDPQAYGASRNQLDGAVTGLSPYIRHGVLSLAEVRGAVFLWLAERGYPRQEPHDQARAVAGKLISELGWRDYWQRLWRQLGDRLWDDLEPLKTGWPPQAYAPALPADISLGRTGLACMDAFVAELRGTGWLHNHARMWLASYVVHWRRVRWQAGARWFLQHLLDGDPASNNLSWQWVASSFSAKPYLFNRANLERFAGDRHCRACALAAAGQCPFEASYDTLQARLFPAAGPPAAAAVPLPPAAAAAVHGPPGSPQPPLLRPIVWVHGEALSAANPALRAWPAAPALFVFHRDLIDGQQLSLKRLGFLYECLLDLPVTLRHGDGAEEVLAFAARHGADGVVTTQAVDPRFEPLRARISAELPLLVLQPEPFVQLERPPDLRRFSRYWRRAEPLVWQGFAAPP